MNVLDMIGKPCPLPVIEAKKALRAAAPGQEIALLVDDEAAVRNLSRLAAAAGHAFKAEAPEGGRTLVVFTVGSRPAPEADEGGLTVAIGRETLGESPGGPASQYGSDLGRALMKAFIQSLTELDKTPERLLFFNGGVFLTVQGSAALGDLKTLEDKGTDIGSCGACLNYYQLTDKLQAGSVTNMFAIASALAQASKVVSL